MFFNHDNSYPMNDLYNDHPKNVLKLVQPYCIEITKHPKVYLEYKDKRTAMIDQACIHYDKAYDVTAMINPLCCSYLLGHSELVLNSFTEECAKLSAAIEYFESVTTLVMKPCQEVNDWYKGVFSLLDKKMVASCFLEDVDFWAKTFLFEYNKISLMSNFNDIKKDHLAFLKKIHQKRT